MYGMKSTYIQQNLVYQLESLDIPVLREFNQEYVLKERLSKNRDLTKQSYQMIVDGMLGFSFKGTPRAPFDSIIQWINTCACKVVCIDIPSGWDVDNGMDLLVAQEESLGPQQEVCIKNPSMLVSLTAPKPCASLFKGEYHALGGRFVPPYVLPKEQRMLIGQLQRSMIWRSLLMLVLPSFICIPRMRCKD